MSALLNMSLGQKYDKSKTRVDDALLELPLMVTIMSMSNWCGQIDVCILLEYPHTHNKVKVHAWQTTSTNMINLSQVHVELWQCLNVYIFYLKPQHKEEIHIWHIKRTI